MAADVFDLVVQAAEFLADPVKVTIGSADLSASHSVSQVWMKANHQRLLSSNTCPESAVECPHAAFVHNSRASATLVSVSTYATLLTSFRIGCRRWR